MKKLFKQEIQEDLLLKIEAEKFCLSSDQTNVYFQKGCTYSYDNKIVYCSDWTSYLARKNKRVAQKVVYYLWVIPDLNKLKHELVHYLI